MATVLEAEAVAKQRTTARQNACHAITVRDPRRGSACLVIKERGEGRRSANVSLAIMVLEASTQDIYVVDNIIN